MKQTPSAIRAIFLALAGITAIPAVAQTTAPGPYYATPSWDQQLPAATRFIVLSNWIDATHPSGGAGVLDRETGLVWERSPTNTGVGWSDAQSHCIGLNAGNRGGWRLPTVQDLRSLVDPTQSSPALPPGHPFIDVRSSAYWSATTLSTDTGQAWLVSYFENGFVASEFKHNGLYVWCVRGGHGVDPQ